MTVFDRITRPSNYSNKIQNAN